MSVWVKSSLEQQRLAGFLGERVGEAIAQVEPGGMAGATTVLAVAPAPDFGLYGSDGHDVYPESGKNALSPAGEFRILAPNEHGAELHPRSSGHPAGRCGHHQTQHLVCLRLLEEHRHDRRGVDDHDANEPSSL